MITGVITAEREAVVRFPVPVKMGRSRKFRPS